MADITYLVGTSDLEQLLQSWAQHGVFTVLIPFILIFAVVFAILERSKVLGNKPAINAIVAISLGLLSLQLDVYRQLFYAQLFENFGTGLLILIVLLVLTGLFITDANGIAPAFKTIGAVIAIVITLTVIINATRNIPDFPRFVGGNSNAVMIMLAVIVFVVFYAISQEKPDDPK